MKQLPLERSERSDTSAAPTGAEVEDMDIIMIYLAEAMKQS
jgi:hypothetical protein